MSSLDCLIVGHNGARDCTPIPTAVLDPPGANEDPGLRELRRTRVALDGQLRTYLDVFSRLRQPSQARGRFPLYSMEELPNLAAIFLTSFLRRHGFAAAFVNSFTMDQPRLTCLLQERPLAVAITTTFYSSPQPVTEIVRAVREITPETAIVVGGPLIFNICQQLEGAAREKLFGSLGADYYVVDAQGEATLVRLLRSLGGSRPGEVANVYRHDGEGWRFAGRSPENNPIDAGAIRWELFEPSELGKVVSTRTARGCAFQCSFCDYPVRAGSLALGSLETLRSELIALARQGVERISFIDDTFNVPVRRFRDICDLLIELDLGLTWYSYFRCAEAREASLYEKMAAAGCRGVLLGLESGDNRMLSAMNKKATTESYRFGIDQLRQVGIFAHASFLVGFPGETASTVDATIEFLERSRPQSFTASPWYYLQSTPVHGGAAELGLRGDGKVWWHSTMSWREAMDQTDKVFAEVRGSCWVPVRGLDFWALPYLLSKGFSEADFLELLRLAREATPLGQSAAPQESSLAKLRLLARRLALGPPRYFEGDGVDEVKV